MDILEAFLTGNGSSCMLVQLTKVLSKSALLLDAKILLVAEENYTSCRNQSCKIVLLKVCEGSKIDAVDLCADLGVVVEDLCSGRQKVLEVHVAKQALVSVRDLFKSRPCDVREAWSQVFELVRVVVLCDCCASGDVVVCVGRLDSLLEACNGCRVT